MDFSNRSVQPQTPASHAAVGGSPGTTKRSRSNRGQWGRVITITLVAALVVLLVALVAFIGFSNNNNDESKYVDTGKLQAVFLNTGQVYFGNIKTLNNRYYVLTNIYYLQTASSSTSTTSTASNNVSLVKLGCELHQPDDQMVINTSQVTFWENLQSTGQVAQAVQTFEKDNPNGQKCSDQSSSSSSTTNSVQSAGSSTTTPATTTKQ